MIDEKKLVDADKLIEDLTEWFSGKVTYCLEYGYDDLREDIEDCFDAFTDIIESQPKLSLENKTSDNDVTDTNVGRWIPCSKRLPNESGAYLVTANDYEPETVEAYYYSNTKVWGEIEGCDTWHNVKAWMEKPVPYKGDK